MKTLTELTSGAHQQLKVKKNAAMQNASNMHVLNLRVAEIAKAASSFPVFVSKHNHDGSLAISALTSIVPGTNTFISEGQWQPLYQPISVRSFPFYLMQSPKDDKSYTIGIFEDSDAFSLSEGEALFEENGRASLYLTEQTKLIEASINDDIQTHQFLNRLDELGLIKSIDLVVQFDSGESQVIKGLSTINEDAMQSLKGESLEELHQTGYLGAIHALLISVFQINQLVRSNNQFEGMDKITQIRMETARDRSAL